MLDKDLDTLLDSYKAPPPSDLLKARILKATQAENTLSKESHPASVKAPFFAKRFMAIAACFIFISAAIFTASNFMTGSTDKAWQMAANDMGFDEIYDWVESDISTP